MDTSDAPAPLPDEPAAEATAPALADAPDRVVAPVLSIVAGLATIAIFGLLQLEGEVTQEVLARFGAPAAALVWAGSWWGLLTSTFVHIEPIHLLCNLSWVWTLGCVVERRAGRAVWIALLVGSSLVASGAELAASDGTGIGFSGAVYAWAGFAWAARRVDGPLAKAIEGQQAWLLGWLVVCWAATRGGMWNVANAAHLGGLAFGLAAGHAWSGRAGAPLALAVAGALSVLGVVPALYAPWSARWWYSQGQAATARDDAAAALAAYDQAVARDPKLAEARYMRGYFREAAGDLAGAEEDATAYLEQVSTWGGGFSFRAGIRARRGALRAALTDCDAALERAHTDEDRVEALQARAYYRGQLELHAEALEDVERLVKLQPDDLALLLQRASARELVDDAAADRRDALTRAAGPPVDEDLLSRAHGALGEGEAALRTAERRVTAEPDSTAALDRRAWARFARSDLAGARADYARVASLDPTALWGHLMSGILDGLAGADSSRVHLQRAVALHPEEPYPALWLAAFGGDRAPLAAHMSAGERPWPGPIARFLAGELDATTLLASAAEAKTARRARERACEAHAFIALVAERAGEAARAREHYQACLDLGVVSFVEHHVARARLASR